MSIISLRTNSPGQNFQAPRLCFLQTNDLQAAIAAPGYLDNYVKMNAIALYPTDFVLATGSNGNAGYSPTFAANGSITLATPF